MPPPYGIVPTGFNIKRHDVLIIDAQEKARQTFGLGVIVDTESPMGQLIELFTYLQALVWEVGGDVYNAFDPDQAEGNNLARIGKLRLLSPMEGESDQEFRKVVTNADRASIDLHDIVANVRAIPGVTYAMAFENNTDTVNANGLAPHSVAVAVLGGADQAVGDTVRRFVVPGVATSGNVSIEVLVDGYCRVVSIIRPVIVNLTLEVHIQHNDNPCFCQAPSVATVRQELYDNLSDECAPINGEDITMHRIKSALRDLPSVEIVEARIGQFSLQPLPFVIGFFQIARFSIDKISVRYAS